MEDKKSGSNKKKPDSGLRLLYLYQLLQTQSDEEHTFSTQKIMEWMEKQHGIYMDRRTVPTDIKRLKKAGIEIMEDRRQSMHYYIGDRTFSVPELKVLIDAVQSSRFITENKSEELIKNLMELTSVNYADKLKRTVHVTGRVKSDNTKTEYIIDAINDAVNERKKISFRYFELDGNKKRVLKNNGKPYTVSPFDLIWDGDYYYLTGFCDERDSVRTFRVDRIEEQPEILKESAVKKPENYDINRYTTEAFRMFAADEPVQVTLLCDNEVMKYVVDKFGMEINTSSVGEANFRVRVKVCTGPTFYRWVFGSNGRIVIEGPKKAVEEYREMLQKALEAQQ